MISFCLTNYNRYELLLKAVEGLAEDSRISEVIISDDCSDYEIFSKVQEFCDAYLTGKIKLYRNAQNLGMSRNKAKAISYAKEEWILIGDSDNQFMPAYLDALPPKLNSDTIYCPAFARPTFDYRKYAGMTLDKYNIKRILHEPMMNCLMNTCNYVAHRESYLQTYVYNEEHIASDTIWFNYNWLKRGGKFYVVPTMEYWHRVHDDAGFKKNIQYNMQKAEEVRKLILTL